MMVYKVARTWNRHRTQRGVADDFKYKSLLKLFNLKQNLKIAKHVFNGYKNLIVYT